MEKVTIQVMGMTCGGCKKSVEAGVTSLIGVNDVNVELESGKVNVEFDASQVDVDQIKNAIQNKGYFVVA